jgi:DNA-binding NtrC family response regulator
MARRIELWPIDRLVPDSRGIATLRSLHDAAPLLPMVVLTGARDAQQAGEARLLGVSDFLIKGAVDAEQLASAIFRHARPGS